MQEFHADTIDDAAEYILLELLKEKTNTTRTIGSRDNVFYFDGWDGLGASAVLRAVAQCPLAGQEFDQVIHIDCSMWESRRALQKAVAEQLGLPSQVMELFDRQDEEDDFRGVAKGSRAELQQVLMVMQQHIQKLNRRFLVIFHNGSDEEIDLASLCGFPLSGFSTNKVLWTFQGRLRLMPRWGVEKTMKSERTTTHAFINTVSDDEEKLPPELWNHLVQKEASEVAEVCKINTGLDSTIIGRPTQVAECFMYMLGLCCRGRHSVDYDWATHGANYWICDGIIKQQGQGDREAGATDGDDDRSWRAADALQSEMTLDVDYHQYLPSSHLARFVESKPSWISPNYGFNQLPDRTIPKADIFQHYAEKLSVLKLSRCTFDFQSPPFLCCYGLRFLWLDHCEGTNNTSPDGTGKEEDIRRCFQRLWVLDLRYTNCDQILSAHMLDLMTQLRELNVIGADGWDMGQLHGRLPNIHKLRVKTSRVSCSCPENDLFSEMKRMEHLDFSGNYPSDFSSKTSLFGPGVSSNVSCLETVVIVDGCFGVEQISFRGCTELKNLLLGGRMTAVRTIDISGTAVKTLDLGKTTIYNLDELYLLDCQKLCAILWPPYDEMKQEGLGKLWIDTTQSAPIAQSREDKAKRGTTETSVAPAATPHGSQPSSEFDWYISVQDARLLGSLMPVYSHSRKTYVEISSPPHPAIAVGGSKDKGIFRRASRGEQQLLVNMEQQPARAVYRDISMDRLQQASEGGAEALGIMWMWPCPDVPDLPESRCYMHIQDQIKTKLPRGDEQTSTTITVPWFVIHSVKILHVHDSMFITSITSDICGSEWPYLEWCRIERCPKLDSVFNNDIEGPIFIYQLRLFWASQLLQSRYISITNGRRAFTHLTLLHLDFCPRLIHVLPFSVGWFAGEEDSLRLLETLEIAWCGNLRKIFPFQMGPHHIGHVPDYKDFPRLKRIHLHELPSLQNICGIKMSAPNLETIKIRGCWSLTRLPDIGRSNKVVECDCEKEWWDRLEWDDRSQADSYRPIHPRYYKKTMLRGSVLR